MRYRFHFRCPLRTAESNREKGRHVDQAPSAAERKRRQKEAGVTGECVFYRLFDLCGFDPLKDMVIDAMHAVILNLVRSELEDHLLADLGANRSKPPHLRDPSEGGLLDVKDLMKSLNHVQWTTELKDGRVPSISPSHNCSGKSKLGHWKSDTHTHTHATIPVLQVLHTILYRYWTPDTLVPIMIRCKHEKLYGSKSKLQVALTILSSAPRGPS